MTRAVDLARLEKSIAPASAARAKGYLQIAGTWEDHENFAKLADEHTITSELVAGG